MRRAIGWSTVIVAAVFCVAVVLMSIVPPFSRDAVIHHLAIPKIYLEQGGIVELPQFFFSYYPQLVDLLYMIPIALDVDFVAKYIHFSFAVCTALMIYLFIRRSMEPIWALVGATLFMTVPVIVKLSVTVYVDLGLVFFSTAALLSTILWLENRSFRWLVVAGIGCGLALSTKYNGLLSLFILTAGIPLFYLWSFKKADRSSKQTAAVGYGAVFLFIALLVFSPWAIKNYIWTGNPLYPTVSSFFASEQVAEEEFVSDVSEPSRRLGHFWYRKHQYDESPLETLFIPVRMFFQGEDNNPQLFDGKLNATLLLFPLLFFIGVKRKEILQSSKVLLLFSSLYILLTYLTVDMRVRYIAPALPVLAILSAYGLNAVWRRLSEVRGGRFSDLTVAGLLLLALVPNVNYLVGLWKEIDPIPYLNGEQDKVEYLSDKMPTFAITHYANMNLPGNSRTLAVYLGARSYYFKNNTDFQYRSFLRYLSGSHDHAEVLRYLSANGFSHLLIRLDMFNRWLSDKSDDRMRFVIAFFNTHAEQLHNANGYGLYRIR